MNNNSYAKQYKYQRIAEDIKIDIFSNRMKGNTPLPSIREYAKKYCVNPNTISNALNLLKNENIIYTYRTKGYFVVENIEDRRYVQIAIFRGQQGRISRPDRAILNGQF